ncbi:MAG: SpoIIE family protein phosphatase, partial [Gammaproteobacteria bacterium]|nr:SpoIIE family protein phosphatase [Gammaproteobacteria bacterium]
MRKGRIEDHLALLAEVSQAFASSLDVDETLQNAVRQIVHFMRAEAASLFLLENSATELVCRSCAGPVDVVGLRIGAEQGIVGKSMRENRVQFIRDVRRDPDFAGFVDEGTGFETRSILCVPLRVKDTRIGALEVINKDSSDGLFNATDRYLLQVMASTASLVIHNARMAAELMEQERMRKELELAREIQAGLLPASRPVGFPLAGINVPALEVSGDFYDYFELDDGRVGFSLGDVSGKGMNAALLGAKVSSLLHALGKSISNPAELMARVNGEICESVTRGMFVTLVVGTYDPGRDRLCFTNAGHLPLLFRERNGGFLEIPAHTPPVGITREMVFKTMDLALEGGSIYLYTDGVTEGADQDEKPLGAWGLQKLINSIYRLPLKDRLEYIVGAINSGAPARKDDVTLLVI